MDSFLAGERGARYGGKGKPLSPKTPYPASVRLRYAWDALARRVKGEGDVLRQQNRPNREHMQAACSSLKIKRLFPRKGLSLYLMDSPSAGERDARPVRSGSDCARFLRSAKTSVLISNPYGSHAGGFLKSQNKKGLCKAKAYFET